MVIELYLRSHLQGFYTSSFNPGTSGSIVDFLNAVFYPNTAPSITTGNITIEEWSGSGVSSSNNNGY